MNIKRIKQTGIEFVVLGVVGLMLAAVANGVRAKGSITLGKNYFFIPTRTDSAQAATETLEHDDAPTEEAAQSETQAKHVEHDYQVITYEAVAALLEDPDTETGLNVFVDARNDHSYEDGHIPGAVQCDPYNVAQYWDNVEPLVRGAMKIVVYCGGGDCEDSIFMCRELQNQDIPWEALYLYEGGWKEWTGKSGPVETGRTE